MTRWLPILGAVGILTVGAAGASADHNHGKRTYSAFDKQSLQTSIEGDRFEIVGGKLAEQKGTSQGVRAYGARLVSDHSKSLSDAVDLAKKLGIRVPTAPTPSMQWELQTVAKLNGADFDAAYADLEAKDHQQDISEAKDEVKDGTNADIRKSARQEIPTLKQHLSIALQLGGKVGDDPLS